MQQRCSVYRHQQKHEVINQTRFAEARGHRLDTGFCIRQLNWPKASSICTPSAILTSWSSSIKHE